MPWPAEWMQKYPQGHEQVCFFLLFDKNGIGEDNEQV